MSSRLSAEPNRLMTGLLQFDVSTKPAVLRKPRDASASEDGSLGAEFLVGGGGGCGFRRGGVVDVASTVKLTATDEGELLYDGLSTAGAAGVIISRDVMLGVLL